MAYTIKRTESTENGTLGELLDESGVHICFTLENPWKDNINGISCIPTGSYKVIKHNGEKYQDVWEITDVPSRLGILIHNGNTMHDTKGCVLVGNQQGTLLDLPAVLNSKTTLDELRKTLPDEFNLIVESCC
jgi:hypothetical protein